MNLFLSFIVIPFLLIINSCSIQQKNIRQAYHDPLDPRNCPREYMDICYLYKAQLDDIIIKLKKGEITGEQASLMNAQNTNNMTNMAFDRLNILLDY